MKIKKLEVVYFVKYLDQTKKWYEKVLGLSPSFESQNFFSFDLESVRISFHIADEKCSPGVSGQVAYWTVTNLQDSLNELIDNGCGLYRDPIKGIDGTKVCQVKDPFGNAIGLVER